MNCFECSGEILQLPSEPFGILKSVLTKKCDFKFQFKENFSGNVCYDLGR